MPAKAARCAGGIAAKAAVDTYGLHMQRNTHNGDSLRVLLSGPTHTRRYVCRGWGLDGSRVLVTLPCSAGDSGGPVYNQAGELVAVVSELAILPAPHEVGFTVAAGCVPYGRTIIQPVNGNAELDEIIAKHGDQPD